MYLSDYTIPEAEVIYQKAIIRGAWWFLAFLVFCVFVYFVVQKIVEDRKDARAHKRKMASIRASEEIGQNGAWTVSANRGQIIRRQQKDISLLQDRITQKDRHIAALESTMKKCNFGDVADRIRKENEDGTNSSEDRS